MATGGKAPPILREDSSYGQWKHQIEAWKLLTEVAEEKQGLSIYLHGLDEKFKDIISKIDIKDLNSKDGVKKIIDKLDVFCESKIAQRQYESYENFTNFKRASTESVSESLMKFESLVNELEELKIVLPQAVKAFHVLKAMNLGESNEKICRATIGELTYDNMIQQIRSVMNTKPLGVSEKPSSEIKVESSENEETSDTFFTRGSNRSRGRGTRRYRYNNRFRGSSDRRCFSCGSPDHLVYDCPNKTQQRRNFSDTTRTNRCFKCQSTEHLSYACPQTISDCHTENVNIILLEALNQRDNFFKETFLCAVIDSGARTNLAGQMGR